MTEKRTLRGTYTDSSGEQTEEFSYEYSEDALEVYKSVIEQFNDGLRPNEKPRTAIKAEWVEDGKKDYFCDFRKVSLMTLKDSKGYYDRVKCVHCGKIRRRYGIGNPKYEKVRCKDKSKHKG